MDKNIPLLTIRATTNQHGFETLLVSAIGLFILMLTIQLKPGSILLAEIFLVSACLVGLLVGYFKLAEPRFSLIFYPEALIFIHKYGSWQVSRKNIAQVGVPSLTQDFESKMLSCVAIRLCEYGHFLNELAPRLSGKILIEQRHFVREALMVKAQEMDDLESYLIEESLFIAADGAKYCGLIAMFANRMINLRQLIGYDLLIPLNMLDRAPEEFVYLLNRWQRDPKSIMSAETQS
ncbi:hypothetical protein PULV_a0807 [Pseudoalteromonas ulvae UL12]|uniref:DUF2982 domain-containing protein n=1 Tax=Pseudoalteromonas ulvae TaxID=107327 RepID=A0A244CNK0_PSEDV|nr:DUF2982 domain-containing protein [Pseudoalteromonas ulvae]MBE0363166.1 hypothetical protein [Pseudoalteromonas ulvae UL12]OUL57197.1 hypothetical protein B1199_13555 [Pseudoalteromonas ulvae]